MSDSPNTTPCLNCGITQWITRERADGTKITRCGMCNTMGADSGLTLADIFGKNRGPQS